MAKVNTIDELDFQYRENVHACKQCQNTLGTRDKVGFNKDKKMYQHVVKFRKLLKKDRIRVEDLSDDPESLEVHRKGDRDNQELLKLVNPD